MNWRERLDARISRCPGCDDWRWDSECKKCTHSHSPKRSTPSVFALPEVIPDAVPTGKEAA